MTFHWSCPTCGRDQVVTASKFFTEFVHIGVADHVLEDVGVRVIGIGCSALNCRALMVEARLGKAIWDSHDGPGRSKSWAEENVEDMLVRTRLVPDSYAKPQPDYIPAALRDDYTEACRIRDLSPKAAATLARRCLQGMIRDFAGVSGATLYAEISSLRKLVEAGNAPSGVTVESVDAIDHVRSIGNIGAHMEKDIDLIVAIDPNEAQVLIELVETLFEDWYVNRHKRSARFARLAEIAAEKAAARALPPPATE